MRSQGWLMALTAYLMRLLRLGNGWYAKLAIVAEDWRRHVGKMSESNKVVFASEAEANAAGYLSCLRCP